MRELCFEQPQLMQHDAYWRAIHALDTGEVEKARAALREDWGTLKACPDLVRMLRQEWPEFMTQMETAL
jgi:hypothetical protein